MDQAALPLQTERLTLRPLTEIDAPAIAAIGGHQDVARMIAASSSPWPVRDAANWIERMAWQNRLGFALGIAHQGKLIGALGCGGTPMTVFFWLDPTTHGQGFATEAMRCFINFLADHFGCTELLADHFEDNPASGHVLRKLGFVETGRDERSCSRARAEPAPAILYRWQVGY